VEVERKSIDLTRSTMTKPAIPLCLWTCSLEPFWLWEPRVAR